jgi:trigger factor
VTFTIVLHEIKKKVLPELDDDLAKEVSEFDTIDELVADIRKGAEEQNRSMADSRLREDLMTKLIADNPFDLPPGLLEKQTRHMAQRRRQQLASQGIDPSAIGMDEAALDGRAADDAVRSLKEQAILAAFGDAAGVRIGDADLDREIARLAAMFGQSPEMTRQQLGQGGGLDALANQAYADKVYAAMMEKIAVAETVEKAAAEPSEG